LVHHFGGNRASVKLHQDFLSDIGLDSVAFTLTMPQLPSLLKKTLLNDVHFKLRERWQKDISEILEAVKGPKIVYSFSFPSAPAVISIAERKAKDIRGWICDGGPFLMPLTCFWNYYKHIEPTPIWLRPTRVAIGVASLNFLTLPEDLKKAVSALPNQFPVLSIRSWQDPLVPIEAIDQVFDGHKQLKFETLTLPEAGHIDGLQKFPEEYKPRVAKFINQIATVATAAESHPPV